MRDLLAWFDPDEVEILVAAFDKAWETVQASGVVYSEGKAEAARAILAKQLQPLGTVSSIMPDCVMAPYWP
jgi:hypothetical protein